MERKKIVLGRFPQSVVSDRELIVELNKIRETTSKGYLNYKGEEYVRQVFLDVGNKQVVTKEMRETATFHNGDKYIKGVTYYFKVEPIEWQVLSVSIKKYGKGSLVVADKVLYVRKFSNDTSDFSQSTIRNWLNVVFYNNAFNNDEKNKIIISKVENFSDNCGKRHKHQTTKDKIFILDYDDVTDESLDFPKFDGLDKDNYNPLDKPFIAERGVYTTDYCLAKNIGWGSMDPHNRFAGWFLRNGKNNEHMDRVGIVNSEGRCYSSVVPEYEEMGIRPAFIYDDGGNVEDFSQRDYGEYEDVENLENTYIKALTYLESNRRKEGILMLERICQKGYYSACEIIISEFQDKDNLKFFNAINKLAETREAKPLYYLSRCYLEGIGVNPNIEEGLNLLKLLSKQNYGEAQHFLGSLYLDGKHVSFNPHKAFELTEKATKNGYPIAYNNLGVMYVEGHGTKVNYKKAMYCFKNAIKANAHEAYVGISSLYRNGLGVNKNIKTANKYLEEGVKKGSGLAMGHLGMVLLQGDGVLTDEEKGFELIKQSALAGEHISQNNLAYFYQNGIGTEKDLEKSFYWQEKAAHSPIAEFSFRLGKMYMEGIGVEENPQKAFELMKKVAHQNHVEGILYLSILYKLGKGVIMDKDKYAYWYDKYLELVKNVKNK